MHSNEYKSETTINYNNISISRDYKTLIDIADNKGPKKKLVILGISSWGVGQLEGEMEREHWILSEINTDLIFGRDNFKKMDQSFKQWLRSTMKKIFYYILFYCLAYSIW